MLLSPPPRPEGIAPEPPRDPRPHPGTGARIWLVRHGRVTAPDEAYGDRDVPLSPEGEAQTRAVAESFKALGVAHVQSSPLRRALAMGEAVAGATGAPLEVDPRLRELHRGDWQGISRVEYARRWAASAAAYWRDPLRWREHGGESEEVLAERAWPAFMAATEAAQGGIAVVTAHRQVLRAVVAAALGLPPGQSHALQWEPARSVVLRDDPMGWTLERSGLEDPAAPPAGQPAAGPPADVNLRSTKEA